MSHQSDRRFSSVATAFAFAALIASLVMSVMFCTTFTEKSDPSNQSGLTAVVSQNSSSICSRFPEYNVSTWNGSELCYDFPLIWSDEEEKLALRLLSSAHEIFSQEGIRYSICWGTALGYSRSKYFTAWDDDIDICFPAQSIAKFANMTILADRGLRVTRLEENSYVRKLIFIDRENIPGYSYSWPFLDLWDIDANSKEYRALFPPVLVKDFGELAVSNVNVYVPRDIPGVLELNYGADCATTCIMQSTCHRGEMGYKNVPNPGRKENCSDVFDKCGMIYPDRFKPQVSV